MSVFFIISIQIDLENERNPYDEYIELVKPIVEKYSGKYIVRSEKITYLNNHLYIMRKTTAKKHY
jgi:uncharacterized protein (DUF1330 family)